MEAADFGTQKKYPGWGSKKIFVRLGRMYAGEKIPSRATISRILKQSGLVKAQSRARRKSGPEREDHRHPATSLKVQRRRTKTWVKIFNEERPHEALGMKAPAELYVVSELKYQPVKAPEYGSEFEVRRVNSKGDIQWLNHRRFIGEAFQGQRLGLRRWNDAIHEVYLCDILLGHLPDAQFFAFRPTVSRRKTARTVPAESSK